MEFLQKSFRGNDGSGGAGILPKLLRGNDGESGAEDAALGGADAGRNPTLHLPDGVAPPLAP